MTLAPPLFLADEAATCALAARLAAHQPAAAVVYLCGDLGAGKSTLARAWLRALGVSGPIRSPTYTLVEPYPIRGGTALHLDLYRLGAAGEWDELGLDDLDRALWLIEWPERAPGHLPRADMRIHLALAQTGRNARVDTNSPAGWQWWQTVQAAHDDDAINHPLLDNTPISGQTTGKI